jgi:hypothetical protein
MDHLPEHDLHAAEQHDSGLDSAATQRRQRAWIGALIFLLVVAAGAYWAVRRQMKEEPPLAQAASAPAPAAPSETALGGTPEPVALPPLESSDPFVRDLAGRLSSHPRVLAWLAGTDLVRNFVVVVVNIANGQSPASRLARLRPSGSFAVLERNGVLVTAPRAFDRYSMLTAAVESVDPAAAASLYATLKPLIETAYKELGYPDTPFDTMLERAIVNLLNTPIPDEPALKRVGAGYAYANPDLEALSSAQKQLLRFGPSNARAIQTALRAIGVALGIPEQRLPQRRD